MVSLYGPYTSGRNDLKQMCFQTKTKQHRRANHFRCPCLKSCAGEAIEDLSTTSGRTRVFLDLHDRIETIHQPPCSHQTFEEIVRYGSFKRSPSAKGRAGGAGRYRVGAATRPGIHGTVLKPGSHYRRGPCARDPRRGKAQTCAPDP